MERLGDDELAAVLKRVSHRRDRKACSEVCKQWARLEGSIRSSLRLLLPQSLPSLSRRFTNLKTLEINTRISDRNLQAAAEICTNLQTLNLNFRRNRCFSDEFESYGFDFEDVTDSGLCGISFACQKLINFSMRWRKGIGDVGIAALISHAKNLVFLDLSWCSGISDTALEAVASLSSLMEVYLRGCYLITDHGLKSLAHGLSAKTMEVFDVSECDRITDHGVSSLRLMSSLQELRLAECGPLVTDFGGACIAAMTSLRRLDLSWLINLSNSSLIVVAQNFQNLVEVRLIGCDQIT
ncbi:F-box/LRR-repeat protein 3-like [Phalaenopsis equestris]|uniref:F-box/LRR-repeat protein 3-like n=1 Tax=Phalaenopsis equestris TaxID=78828 RepID=UPI0009E36543|nr:F-box/LRR-repeat protein 3-like [Phalaenopsis equestris]